MGGGGRLFLLQRLQRISRRRRRGARSRRDLDQPDAQSVGDDVGGRHRCRGPCPALSVDWQAIGLGEPEQIEATFDGQPLDVTNPDNVPLPSHDARDFHFVSAAVDFSDLETSRRETELGGVRSQKIATELTAVVVQLDRRLGLPSAAKMESWFVKDGQPLEVHGVEKGSMALFVVRGPGSQEVLDELAVSVLGKSYKPVSRTGFKRPLTTPDPDWRPETFFAGDWEVVGERIRSNPNLLAPLRLFAPFDRQIGLRFVSPVAGILAPGGLEPEMFLHSRVYAGSEGGLSWLGQKERPTRFGAKTHEALTVAGMTARSENRRRAVLLITAPAAPDFSTASAADARDFLSALQVPLYVWSFGAADPGWGDVVDLGDPGQPAKVASQLAKATIALERDLKRQRIVWLKGRHLPHRIELGPAAKGVRLAGS